MTRFSIDSVKIEDDGDTAVTMRLLNSFRHTTGIQTTGPDTGNPYVEQKYVTTRAEEFAFESTALETLLDTISLLTGKCVVDGATEVGLEFYGQAHDPCGTNGRTTGSTNLKKLCEHSHLLITNLQASVGQDATASVRAICLSDDGSNAPTSTVYNAALPSSPITDEVFTLYPPTIAGTTLAAGSVQSVSLDTGIDVRVIQAAGSIYPTEVLILKSMPTIRIVTEDISTIEAAIGLSGTSCALANSNLYFQKRQTDGGLIAVGSSEHVKITYEGFAYINENFNASGHNVGTMEVVIECTEPTSGTCLTVTTDSAIT